MHPPPRGRAPVDERPGGRDRRGRSVPGLTSTGGSHRCLPVGPPVHRGVTPLPAGASPRENKTGPAGRRPAAARQHLCRLV